VLGKKVAKTASLFLSQVVVGNEEEKSDIKSYQSAGWRWETSGVALGMNFPDMVGLCSGFLVFSCVCFFDALRLFFSGCSRFF